MIRTQFYSLTCPRWPEIQFDLGNPRSGPQNVYLGCNGQRVFGGAINYLIWDFDGTLGYRIGMWSGTLLEVLSKELPDCDATMENFGPHLHSGFPWHHPEITHKHLRSPEAWWEALVPIFERAFHLGTGLPMGEANRLASRVREAYVDPAHWRLFEDTIPCLGTLADQNWLHVVLSNHVPELSNIIDGLGLGPYILKVFNSAETGFEKPHPQAFRNVLAELGSASTVCIVGDNPVADIAGAQAVGIGGVLVRSRNPGVEHCCETLADLPTLLKSLFGEQCSHADIFPLNQPDEGRKYVS